jgi:hypothetical protein
VGDVNGVFSAFELQFLKLFGKDDVIIVVRYGIIDKPSSRFLSPPGVDTATPGFFRYPGLFKILVTNSCVSGAAG